MTLIAGYIYNDNTVHIVADSAVTYKIDNDTSTIKDKANSIGEHISTENGLLITESAQKLYSLDNSIIIGFAGENSEGNQIIEDLIIWIRATKGSSLSNNITSFFEERKPEKTEFLIGYQEENIGYLISYINKLQIFDKIGSIEFIGNGFDNEEIKIPILFLLGNFSKSNNPPSRILIFIIAMFQCCSLNSRTFQYGYGGFFNGLYVDKLGVHWAEDTSSFIYSSKHIDKIENFLVNKFNREGATFLTSPKIEKSIFYSGLKFNKLSPKQWTDKWIEKLIDLNTKCQLKYYCFICHDRRIVVVLNRENDRFEKHLNITVRNDDKIDLTISSSLMNNLISYQIDEKTGKEINQGIPIQFHYM